MGKIVKILFLGDIIGDSGCRAVYVRMKSLIDDYGANFSIVNGENSAGGFGITPSIADRLFSVGVDVITTGNHIWQKSEIIPYMDKCSNILRPCNYSSDSAGHGYTILEKHGVKLCVINSIGRHNLVIVDCPFKVTGKVVNEVKHKSDIIFVDFHAEIAEEKEALANYLDGRVGAVVGTHTHIQTADEKILPNGTAYITDVGMCGAVNSVIGGNPESSMKRVLTQLPHKIEIAEGDIEIRGVVIEFDVDSGKALSINRIKEIVKNSG